MKTLAIHSCFLNSESKGQVGPYFAQIAALKGYLAAVRPDIALRCIAVEGNSTDLTLGYLDMIRSGANFPIEIVDGTVPNFRLFPPGSTSPDRMRQFATASRAGFDAVTDDDFVLVIESDLKWLPEAIVRLLGACETHAEIVAALPFVGKRFYDTWAFREPGRDAFSIKPYGPWPWVRRRDGGAPALTELDSAGSCLMMRGWVARNYRPTDEEAIVGFCKDAKRDGLRIVAYNEAEVEHPA